MKDGKDREQVENHNTILWQTYIEPNQHIWQSILQMSAEPYVLHTPGKFSVPHFIDEEAEDRYIR